MLKAYIGSIADARHVTCCGEEDANSSLNYAYTPLLNADPIIRMKDRSERDQAQKDDAEEDQADGLKSNSHRRKKVQ